jgi:glycosyltransferase involved in cell wall biosynthesis
MKLLSVIIPIYNAEKYLVPCIESLVNQTYKEKEIILVDDGSTDSSAQICDDYCKKYSFVRCIHKSNAGVMAARNSGLEMAQGDYIALIDADDCMDLNAYEILIKSLENNNCDIAAGGYIIDYDADINYEAKPIKKTLQLFESNDAVVLSLLSESNENCIAGYMWNKVYTRKALKGIRFRDDIVITDDLMFTWDVIRNNVSRACLINEPFYHYRYIYSSATKSSSVDRSVGALKTWKIIMYDIKGTEIEDRCIKSLASNYLIWNLIVAKRMLESNSYRDDVYSLIKNNIVEYKEFFCALPKQNSILAKALLRSWSEYKFLAKIIFGVKKAYVNMKERL